MQGGPPLRFGFWPTKQTIVRTGPGIKHGQEKEEEEGTAVCVCVFWNELWGLWESRAEQNATNWMEWNVLRCSDKHYVALVSVCIIVCSLQACLVCVCVCVKERKATCVDDPILLSVCLLRRFLGSGIRLRIDLLGPQRAYTKTIDNI